MKPIALLSLSLTVALAACQPNGKTVMALLYDQTGKLKPTQTELPTITSIANLKGSAAQLVGGARIVLNDPSQPEIAGSDDQIANQLLRDPGGDVRANFIDKAGVLWPADFHSWNMVTTYWNFEKALAYYTNLYDGDPVDKLANPKVYYWGDYEDLSAASDSQQLKDNAIYFSPVKGFVLSPFYSCPAGTEDSDCGCPSGSACFQQVPLAMNLGVIGHEMNHRVFSQRAYGGVAIPPYLAWGQPGFNILKSIDEGLSDFHGYGVTCDAIGGPGCSPNYLAASLPAEVAAPRDFTDNTRCMTVELRTAIANLQPGQFIASGKQYELGTLFATALYLAGNKGGKLQILQKAVIRSYTDTSSSAQGFAQVLSANLENSSAFTLELATNTLLSHITDPDLKRLTCNELWDRLDLTCDDDGSVPCANFPACPNTSVRGTSCPRLPDP